MQFKYTIHTQEMMLLGTNSLGINQNLNNHAKKQLIK